MKIYSANPGEAAGAKYAKKKKRVHTRQVVERQHRKAARLEPAKEKADEPLPRTTCSRSSDTPYSDLHCWYYDASDAETRARREMTGYHVRLSAAQEMERRLHVIASDAACVNDEWLAQQGEGIRAIIANIRRHANLSENH